MTDDAEVAARIAWWQYHYGVDNLQEWREHLAEVRRRNRESQDDRGAEGSSRAPAQRAPDDDRGRTPSC